MFRIVYSIFILKTFYIRKKINSPNNKMRNRPLIWLGIIILCVILFFIFYPTFSYHNYANVEEKEMFSHSVESNTPIGNTMIPYKEGECVTCKSCEAEVEANPPAITPFSPNQRGWSAGSPDSPMTEAANLCDPSVLIPISQPTYDYPSAKCAYTEYVKSP